MPRPKSLLQSVEVDEVLKAHNCQHNRRHRLERGEKRLKLRKGRTYEHYCTTCGLKIIEQDIAKLQSLAAQLKE